MLSSPGLEVLLPVHDQAESIEAVIRELHAELSPLVRVSFIVCEDGSRDNTRKILRRLAKEFPIRLHVSDQCKGYPRTVCEGMDLAEAKWLLCIDADGRFDPKEFSKFWQRRAEGEVLLGRRTGRRDSLPHKAMSRFFYAFYQSLFHVPVHDPKLSLRALPQGRGPPDRGADARDAGSLLVGVRRPRASSPLCHGGDSSAPAPVRSRHHSGQQGLRAARHLPSPHGRALSHLLANQRKAETRRAQETQSPASHGERAFLSLARLTWLEALGGRLNPAAERDPEPPSRASLHRCPASPASRSGATTGVRNRSSFTLRNSTKLAS